MGVYLMHGICVVGLGYVGLSLGVFLASKGVTVYGYDIENWKLESLKMGKPYIFEEGLKEKLDKVLHNMFIPSSDLKKCIEESNIIFICVGTPVGDDWRLNYNYILSAAKEIGKVLEKIGEYRLVVVKSTILPESSRKLVIPAIEFSSGLQVGTDFGYVYNPEFLREGVALRDLEKPFRIVIGEYDRKSGDILYSLYKSIYNTEVPIIRTTIENAEIIKYASNAFLSLKVSFINYIARICEDVPNADITIVSKALGFDPRIGAAHLNAGIGFGGQCLPKDLKAFISFVEERGLNSSLLRTIYDINEEQALWPIEVLKRIYDNIKGRKVSVLGLTFKPNTDDIRGSQAIKVIKHLISAGAKVKVYDPRGSEKFTSNYYYLPVTICKSVDECLRESEAVIIATEWDEFKEISIEKFKKLMKRPIVIDGRRIYDPDKLQKEGIIYVGVGYHSNIPSTLLEM